MNPTDPTTVATVAGSGAASGLVALVAGIDDPVMVLLIAVVVAPIALLMRLVWVLVNGRTKTIETLRADKTEAREALRTSQTSETALTTENKVLRKELRGLINHVEDVARESRGGAPEHTDDAVLALIGRAGKAEVLLGDDAP